MSIKRQNELQRLIAEKSATVEALFAEGDKRGGVNTQDEMKSISDLNKEIVEHQTELSDVKAALALRAENQDRLESVHKTSNQIPFTGAVAKADYKAGGQILSDAVLSQDRFKAWLDEATANGHVSERTALQSPRVDLGKSFSLKTLVTGVSDTQAGSMVFPDFKPIVDQSYQRPLTLRDLVTIGATDSDQIEYVRVTGVTNAAAPTAESTSPSDGAKPESAIATARVVATVKTIAHWIPITNRALADAPQIRTIIDSFLRYGLLEELEDQMLTGNNSGENFDGVLNATGTTAQAYDTDILTTTRKGRTKVRVTGRATPTAWVMHPNDWQAIDLLTDNENRYYYGGPQNPGQPRLWGLPVVECEAMTEGTAVVADWRLAVLWDRMQTQISMTNSHSDYFVKNLIAVLAELRAAFGLIRPKAFVICDLTA